jgi:hypothetical protein
MHPAVTKISCVILVLLAPGLPVGTTGLPVETTGLPVETTGQAAGFIEGQRSLVRKLCGGGDYFGCITETRRLMQYDRGGSECEYRFLIAAAYYRGGQYRSALALEGGACGAETRERALLAMSYLRLGDYGASAAMLGPLSYESVEPAQRLSLLALRIELAVSGGRPPGGRPLQLEIADAAPFLGDDAAFIRLVRLADGYLDVGRKSPALSVALSAILPGAGQVYSGMPLEGLLGFIGIAAAGTGAWLLYRGGRHDLSYVCVAFGGLFYAGNLYGACNAANRWNSLRDRRFIEGVRGGISPEYDPLRDLGGSGVMR